MPELPEVEVTRRSIEPGLRKARVLWARLGKPLRWPLGCAPQQLAGREVGDIVRRGKYLWLALGPRPGQPAADAGGLLLHLGMSGSLSLAQDPAPLGEHEHFELATTGGSLRLKDPRRFGAVIWSASMDEGMPARLLARLGPEPDDPRLSDSAFHAALRRRHTAVKAALLSGELVVGAGNIYACEALFAAGIDPRARCDHISRVRAARLLQAVRQTLHRAVAMGGSTLRDFRDAHGMGGAFQTQARVYGREGQPCTQCCSALRRIVQAQRSTYFCPRCQKR